MLALFPELLDWGFAVPFFFRIFLGCYLLRAGWRLIKHIPHPQEDRLAFIMLGILIDLLGVMLLVGIHTQVTGATVGIIALIAPFLKKKKFPTIHESISFYFLFALVAFALIFLGAGIHAFDLPL